ncbi:hypothetical protein ISN44_As06g034250 [Arabidopsis suecica]|uniref:Uncharacterized protein n=1 Tax=Arabidopsis suecica TaxID=45249 RepID=A0A8T2CIF9_ARASU|nr:hypothetical protein ISN44_As06g034250 [Arabidopsis suecica]
MAIPMSMAMATLTDSVSRVWSMSSLKSALPSIASLRLPSSSSRRPVTLRLPISSPSLPSFSGLSPVNPLLSIGLLGKFPFSRKHNRFNLDSKLLTVVVVSMR